MGGKNSNKTTLFLEPEMSKCLVHCLSVFSLLGSCTLHQNRDDKHSRSTVLVSNADLGLVKQINTV